MTLKTAKRALLDKARLIEQTDDDHWLLEPILIALESMDKLEKNSQELEFYKKALDYACYRLESLDMGIYSWKAETWEKVILERAKEIT